MDLAQPAFPRTTRQLCGALSQPRVQGRGLSPPWQSCEQPWTISCMLEGYQPAHWRLLYHGAAACGVTRSGMKQQLLPQTPHMVRAGQRGEEGGARGFEL